MRSFHWREAPPLLCLFTLSCGLGCSSSASIGGIAADGGEGARLDARGATGDAMDPAPDAACGELNCVEDAGRCSQETSLLNRQRLAVHLVMDDAITLLTAWPRLLTALDQLLSDERSDGLAMGLQLFGASCDPTAYETPLVPIATLPGNIAALRSAVPATASKVTPTLPALRGALQGARAWASAHDQVRTVALFVTDASQETCDLSSDFSAAATQAARDALLGSPSVQTYLLGFGTAQALTSIARAGGTDVLSLEQTVSAEQMGRALLTLRDRALPCVFAATQAVSEPARALVTVGSPLDPERSYPLHASRFECDAAQQGFYMEDAQAAFPIVACPATCAALRPTSQVRLGLECAP